MIDEQWVLQLQQMLVFQGSLEKLAGLRVGSIGGEKEGGRKQDSNQAVSAVIMLLSINSHHCINTLCLLTSYLHQTSDRHIMRCELFLLVNYPSSTLAKDHLAVPVIIKQTVY